VTHPDQGKVALKYGPLIYNIERVDQDIAKTDQQDAPLTAEWRPDLLGGVMVIKASSPMAATCSPSELRPYQSRRCGHGVSARWRPRRPRPLSSIVWIKEG